MLITADGVSVRERNRLRLAEMELLDTTCPLVKRVHQAAAALEAEGYFVLLIGKRGHVEVARIIDDLKQFEVVEAAAEVRAYSVTKLGIVCQTRASERTVATIRTAVATLNPGARIKYVDTVCLPTKENQRALENLLEQVEAVVVVGGRNSNNTQELVAPAGTAVSPRPTSRRRLSSIRSISRHSLQLGLRRELQRSMKPSTGFIEPWSGWGDRHQSGALTPRCLGWPVPAGRP